MTFREFLRFHLLKVLLGLVVLQIVIIAFFQNYNHRPQVQSDQANVIEERTVKISPLLNDSDKDDNEDLSVMNVLSPLNGKVEQNNNFVYYTPNHGFLGVDSFVYTITDGKKESKQGFIVITVNKNLEPIGKKDSVNIYIGGNIYIDVLGNDNDREDDSIFVKEFTNPKFGKIKLLEGKLIYSASNSVQLDSFYYTVSDGRSDTEKIPVLINVKGKSDPEYPWLSMDMGNYSIPGSFKIVNNKFIVKASGSDISNEQDGLRYVYQQINGDFEMVTRVDSIIADHKWAKAALMIRESFSGGSKTSMVLLSYQGGARVQNRFNTNARMKGGDKHTEVKAPYWMKFVRKGDLFISYISPNRKEWKKIASIQNPMSKNTFIGLGFCSHNNDKLGKVIFSNFKLIVK